MIQFSCSTLPLFNMGSSSGTEGSTNKKALNADLAKVKRSADHVKATEDAYRARVATMYDGEYAQLDDQVHARAV